MTRYDEDGGEIPIPMYDNRPTPQPSTPSPAERWCSRCGEYVADDHPVHEPDGYPLMPGINDFDEPGRADSPSPEGAPTVPADWEEGLFDRTHPSNHRILLNGHGNRWCGDCKEWVYLNGRIPPSPEGAEPRTEAQNLLMMLAVNAERAGRDVTVAPVVIFDALREAALPEPPPAAALAEKMTRLADGPRSKWHDEVLPNGAGESWVCVPIGDVMDALPAALPEPPLDVEALGRAFHEVSALGGPLTPCGYVAHPSGDYVKVGYNENPPEDEYACLCAAIASAILARLGTGETE